ncbi:RAD51-associated protein 1 [Orycteropus afer afer]|uniref:RAD51-associated protein 1 n=1 Tax=Orycteropus afer afer TaxID=1230840 RepID=A0A8B6ZI72_ORYAF|nr:RAD51-associated protein 1 [Orycteropus afer afer]
MRPVRYKKPVDYSQFEDSDSDGDFVSTAPLNKKSRTDPKELKQKNPEPKLKNLQKEDIPLEEKTPKKRLFEGIFSVPTSIVPLHSKMALDDKLYQRDLEVALALSVKETPTVTIAVPESESQDKSIRKYDNSETEAMAKSPHISNCSVASDYLDLDKITEEDFHDVQGKRKAASKAVIQQRKILLEGSDGDSVNNSESDLETSKDSEDESDFGESEDNDEEFTVRKSKVKEIKRKEVKVKPPVEKKEKKPKSICNSLVFETSFASI